MTQNDFTPDIKEQLRKIYKIRYRKTSEVEHQTIKLHCQRLCQQLQTSKKSLHILVYKPFITEVSVDSYFKTSFTKLYYPKVRGTGMVYHSINSKLNFLSIAKFDLIVVPGLFFNDKGFRLGRGGGFYDRVLRFTKISKTVFVGREWQRLQNLPIDLWDKRVGTIITENFIQRTYW